MEEEGHAGNGGGGEVLLLAEELAPERAIVAVIFFHMVNSFEQHAARAASGIVDGLALARIKDLDHEPHDCTWRVKLASLLVGDVGELLYQVFVGLPEDV